MATATYKVLGQSAPSATEAIISTLVIANRGTTGGTYRVSVAPDGAALANSQYIAYDVTLTGNNTTALTLGITVNATDVIRVYASSADFTFSAFGSEIA